MGDKVLFDNQETGVKIEEFLETLARVVLDSPTPAEWALVGIHRRGDVLAERIQRRLADQGVEIPLGVMDITLYRDDFSPDRPQPTVRPSTIPFDVDAARILLVDDVFHTGRTIRAALTHLADFGRPKAVVLGVLVDLDSRELPIRPDFACVPVDGSRYEQVLVRLEEVDGQDQITCREKPEGADA